MNPSDNTRTGDSRAGSGSVDNLSGRQFLTDTEATIMQQSGIQKVIYVAANESSTRTIDSDSEQDGHVRVDRIGNCPIQPADQLKQQERGSMADQYAAAWSWSCPTAVESIP